MIKVLIAIVLIIVLFVIKAAYVRKKRQKDFSEKFPTFKKMVAEGKYDEALEMLTKEPILIWRYKLEPSQRREIIELEIKCLEKINKISDAVISLACHLSTVYKIGEWPQDLLTKWVSLYKSCDPINIEKFYFCQSCGLHPETEELLKHVIEKEGCNPPVGFPGKNGSRIIIEWGGKKMDNKK